MYLEDHEQ